MPRDAVRTNRFITHVKMLMEYRCPLKKLRLYDQKHVVSNNCQVENTETNQRTEIYEHKIDTSSDGTSVPMRMFKALYPHTRITDLDKSIDKKMYHTRTITEEYCKWSYAR